MVFRGVVQSRARVFSFCLLVIQYPVTHRGVMGVLCPSANGF